MELYDIEKQLWSYPKWRARVDEIRAQLEDVSQPIHARYQPRVEVKHEFQPSDPVPIESIKREKLWREMEEIKRDTSRVERFLRALTVEQRRVIEAYYFDGKPQATIAEELNKHRHTVRQIREEALGVFLYMLEGA